MFAKFLALKFNGVHDKATGRFARSDGSVRPNIPTDHTDWRDASFKNYSKLRTGQVWEQDNEASKTRLSPDELLALRLYTGSKYVEINQACARMHPDSLDFTPTKNSQLSMIKSLDSALEKSSIPEAVKVFRGMNLRPPLGGEPSDVVGKVYTDNVFKSTSLTEEIAHRFASGRQRKGEEAAVLEIKLPKGSKGLYVGKLSPLSGEEEVLLPRSAKFVITGHRMVMRDKTPLRIYEAEYIN